MEEVAEEIGGGTATIILAHIDQLPDETMRALYDVLEPHRESTDIDRPWVVATRGQQLPDYDGDLARLLRCFPARCRSRRCDTTSKTSASSCRS